MKLTVAILLALQILGCGLGSALSDADALADQFYSIVATGDVDRIMGAYSEEFFGETPESEWRATLNEIYAKSGQYTSHEVTNATVAKMLFSGTTYRVEVKVNYENTVTIEYLTFVGSETPRLAGHFFQLDQEFERLETDAEQIAAPAAGRFAARHLSHFVRW